MLTLFTGGRDKKQLIETTETCVRAKVSVFLLLMFTRRIYSGNTTM